MTDTEVSTWFDSFDTVMTDCDGVLWVGAEPISGSPEMINRFRDLGKRVFFVTNNSTKHRREYKTKLDKLGFGGTMVKRFTFYDGGKISNLIFLQDEIVGTAYLAATYLEQINFDKSKLVYVVGSSGITQELDDVGIKYLPIGVRNTRRCSYPCHIQNIRLQCLNSLTFMVHFTLCILKFPSPFPIYIKQ